MLMPDPFDDCSYRNAVAVLIKANSNMSEDRPRIDALLFQFNRILESNIWDGVKETTLVIIGLIGR